MKLNTKMKYRVQRRTLSAIGFSSVIAIANAQSPSGESGANAVALDEIVVTAQKREQSINDVPMSISALSAADLAKNGVNSIADLAQFVPGMSYTETRTGNPVYTIRGVGFNDSSLAGYPTVSTYLDQSPLPFPALSSHTQFDLERLEVLKGPQGTLFGQNATGGAINLIVKKPTKDFEAGFDVGYGRFNSASVEGFVSGPVAPGLSMRFAGRFERADGWQQSNTRDDTNGRVGNFMARWLTDYEPNDNIKLEFALTGWKDRSQPQALQYIGLQPNFGLANIPASVLAEPLSRQNNRSADWTPGEPRKNDDLWRASLRADIQLPLDITLTSDSAYVRYRQNQAEDVDGLPQSIQNDVYDVGDIKSFTQELRLAGVAKDKFRWMFGGNFEHSQVFQDIGLDFRDSSGTAALAGIGYPIYEDHNYSDQRMRNIAVFTADEFNVTQNFTLKAGARFTHTNREASICNADNIAPYITGAFFYDILAGGAFGAYPPGTCFAINSIGTAGLINPPPLNAPGQFQAEQTENNVSWTVGAQWKPIEGTMVYANASKGYKAGGFATLAASTFRQYEPVTQESVMAYEIGSKSKLANGLLQVNAAAFFYDYKDKQLLTKVNDITFGILDVLQNIPRSTIRGAELELLSSPIRGLHLSLSGTYMDSKINDFSGINSAGIERNFAGVALPYTPRWQVSTDAEYRLEHQLGRFSPFIGASLTYRSSTVATIGGEEAPTGYIGEASSPYSISSQTLVNLRAGLNSEDGRWRYQIWGRNIFNRYYWTETISQYDTVGRYTGMPATFGINVSYRMK